MPIHIRLADKSDAPAIVAVGAAAFTTATDPITRAIFPPRLQPSGRLDPNDYLRWRMRRKVSQLEGEHTIVMVAVAADEPAAEGDAAATTPGGERIVGFSVWVAPHAPGEELKRPEPPDYADKEVLSQVTVKLNEGAVRLFGEGAGCDTWYLAWLGTDPGYRRQGVGKMLVEWGMEKATEEGKDCYLVATPSGKMLYSHLGFEDVGSIDLCGAPHTQMIIKNDSSRWQ